ncbi:MAG: energy-coupling factor transporter ATPase [Clostridia bacterium]|nr:energy-coupling factor transporter ATPase [Clostridia bacterium]
MQIIAKGLNFVYNKKTKFSVKALDNVDLTIDEGDFFGIIGHTGSGKSTFIQHLNALVPVQEGVLKVGDYDLSANAKKDKKALKTLRSKVGMVFQYPEYQLFEDTVFKDVAFGFSNFFPQASKRETADAVYEALSLVGLDPEKYAERSPFDLSGGQKRRVAIAGVIVTRPEILVLDEPVAGLDPKGKRELMKLLRTLHEKESKTIIIVSHDMDEVAENCNKVAVFSEGKIVRKGTPKDVFSDAEEIKKLRLDLPLTGYLCQTLKSKGVNVDCDLTEEDFIRKIQEIKRG